MTDIGEQDASYKRGLVLGLTMAEVMILILFILLLLLATLVRDLEQELDVHVRENAGLQTEVVALRDQRQLIVGRFGTPEKIDDLFTELKLVKEQVRRVPELEEQIVRLTAERDANASARELIADLDAMNLDVRKAEDRNRFVAALQTVLDVSHEHEQPPLDRLESVVRVLGQGGTRTGDLEGQVKNLLTRLNAGGRGTEKPACWADKETGKTEYIFDVALGPDGFRIRDRKLPYRKEAQALLPLQSLVFDVVLNPGMFMDQTRPLFDWSEKHNCRFFVRAFDRTAPEEKELYKVRMRTLEEHFYNYEVIDEQF